MTGQPSHVGHGDHRGEVENGFLSDAYRASCSCGWRDDNVYTASQYAEAAVRRHLDVEGQQRELEPR